MLLLHFTNRETEAWRCGDLVRITQLVNKDPGAERHMPQKSLYSLPEKISLYRPQGLYKEIMGRLRASWEGHSENKIRSRVLGQGQASLAKTHLECPRGSLQALRHLREDIAHFLMVICSCRGG